MNHIKVNFSAKCLQHFLSVIPLSFIECFFNSDKIRHSRRSLRTPKATHTLSILQIFFFTLLTVNESLFKNPIHTSVIIMNYVKIN